jgi:hypothetical protein
MDAIDIAEIHRSLGRIEGKQDSILSAQSSLRTDHNNLKTEVDAVRSRLNFYAGGLAAFSFLGVFLKDKIIGVFA